jgi:energy-converting hydrogenase Eha subunit E
MSDVKVVVRARFKSGTAKFAMIGLGVVYIHYGHSLIGFSLLAVATVLSIIDWFIGD